MINRQKKAECIQSLKSDFSAAKATFLVNVRGLTVSQMQTLRSDVRRQGGALKVAKMTLVRRAVDGLEVANLAPFLKGQLAVVFTAGESPALAKLLNDFAQKHKALQLVAGSLDSLVIGKEEVIHLAALPSKDVMRAQALAAIQASMAAYVRLLSMVMQQLLIVLKKLEEKKAA